MLCAFLVDANIIYLIDKSNAIFHRQQSLSNKISKTVSTSTKVLFKAQLNKQDAILSFPLHHKIHRMKISVKKPMSVSLNHSLTYKRQADGDRTR